MSKNIQENKIITENSDFLFFYEAIQCNPNGDPDQENKPRMDYDTNTNLVTDVRVKRYIRDYLKQTDEEIFVDFEGGSKVTMDEKLKAILRKIYDNDQEMQSIINNETLFEEYLKIKEKNKEETIKKLVAKKPANKKVNLAILSGLVRRRYIDIRLFGSAFAVDGFNRSMTGPIQLNWGYSLNNVYLMDSPTIVSIMNDDNSTFGKDYRVKYSLLAFHGSINQHAARTTGMTVSDRKLFREAIWNSISANPTRTKLNQFPKFYLEIVYNEGFHNGYFGDLRNMVKVNPRKVNASSKDLIDDREVRGLDDLNISLENLKKVISQNEGDNSKPIKEVIIKKSSDLENLWKNGSN